MPHLYCLQVSGNASVGSLRNFQDGISRDLDVHCTRSRLDDCGTRSVHIHVVRKCHGTSHAPLRILLCDLCIEYEVLESHKTTLDCASVAHCSALVDIVEILERISVHHYRSHSRDFVSVGNLSNFQHFCDHKDDDYDKFGAGVALVMVVAHFLYISAAAVELLMCVRRGENGVVGSAKVSVKQQ